MSYRVWIGLVLVCLGFTLLCISTQSDDTVISIDDELAIEYNTVIEDPPEINQLKQLSDDYAVTRDPYKLIEMGDIWNKGAYPRFRADQQKALEYYEMAANTIDRTIPILRMLST